MTRHVHMLDLDRPDRPRLRRSACKDCVAREAELKRLRKVEEAATAVESAWTVGHMRRDSTGADTSTVRGRVAIAELRAALSQENER